jgi:hypothetical protein
MSNSIQVFVIGALHMSGISQKGAGSAYDFAQVSYLVPAQPLNNANCTRTVAGLEPITINLSDKSLVNRLQAMTFPRELNLELAPDPLNVQRNICVGFSDVLSPLNLNDTKKADFSKMA